MDTPVAVQDFCDEIPTQCRIGREQAFIRGVFARIKRDKIKVSFITDQKIMFRATYPLDGAGMSEDIDGWIVRGQEPSL